MISRYIKILLVALGLAALFVAGLGLRRAVLSAQYGQYGRPLPFNMESALEFRYIRMLFETGRIPALDKAVQVPEGVVPRATYTLGAEYVYAAVARLFPRRVPLDERIRWIAVAWFCLGIPLMGLWLWAWTRSVWAAGIAGAYYAVSLAAVMRSTGQELQHENFALPFLIAHWALGAWAIRISEANAQRPTLNAQCLTPDAGTEGMEEDAGRRTTRDAWQAPNHAKRVASLSRVTRDAGRPLSNIATSAQSAKWPLAAQGGDGEHRTKNDQAPPEHDGEQVAEYRTKNEERRTKNAFLVVASLSAIMLACAVSFWDLVQFYVIFWGIMSFVRFVDGRYFKQAAACQAWWLTLLALVAAGVLNPYLRAHSFNFSYGMLLAFGVALGLGVERIMQFAGNPAFRLDSSCAGNNGMGRSRFRRKLVLVLIALLPLAAGVLWMSAYGETYNHFVGLLWAKLRFLNQKPPDPALLTFDQRILWTAPLNSANFFLTRILFPVTLPLSFLAGIIALFHTRTHSDPEIFQLLGYTAISLLAFVLFVRLHVFVIMGFAALLGWLGYWLSLKRTFIRWLIMVCLLAGAGVEAGHVLDNPARWGSVPVYLDEKRDLCRWLRSNTDGATVLANFGISAFLLTYADSPIVLHPKFEAPVIRDRVRSYGNALFKSDEAGFRAWMEPFGAPYYIYALGEFSDVQPEYQMRYCVNALNPPAFAAARGFEYNPEKCRYFRFLWGNAKYRVFRVITRADEGTAARIANEAGQALRQGRKRDAEDKATQALMYDPWNTNAMQILLQPR